MYSRYQFFAVALPLSALLLALPAGAETMPPLTVVEEDVLPQNITPTKMAEIGGAAEAETIKLASLTAAGMQEAFTTPAPAIKAGSCVSHNITWQRGCADAGYPENYTGFIRGETQVDCAANEQRDVWLANSCAAPVALAQIQPQSQPAAAKPVAIVPKNLPALQLAQLEPLQSQPLAIIAQPAPEARVSAPAAAPDQPVRATGNDGQCGAASKALRIDAPTTDLCLSGVAAAVVGQGPWQWSCQGTAGGKNDLCIALVDVAALAEKQKALLAVAPAPAPVAPVIAEPIAARTPDLPPVPPETPQLAAAPALSTPQLGTPTLTAEISTRTDPLTTAALATPRLNLPARSPLARAGSTDYAPAEPVRAAGTLQPRAGNDSVMIDAALTQLQFASGRDAPDEAILVQLETLGQRLAVNRMAKVTVTAYAGTDENTDARGARRLSLARAFAIRDALMLGGASSDQIRIRALGANGSGSNLDRAELTEN